VYVVARIPPDQWLTGDQYNEISALRWLTHFRIFFLVPLEGSVSYVALAEAAKVSVRQLKTVARMAMTSHLFCEPSPGNIAHTATSAMLVTNTSFHDWASFMTEVSVPSCSRLVEASERWPGSTNKTETSYNIAFNTTLPFFDHLATMPDKTRQFASYMKHSTNSEGTAIEHLLNGFDWASLGKATVVDVGGSTGNAAIRLARRFQDLEFVVQDLPENAAAGEATIGEQGSMIASRIRFQGHDFFQEQPVLGAQAYLLRMILHDWPLSEATKILASLVPALTESSRIVIMDAVLPTPGSLPSSLERQIRAKDMVMMQVFNSMERDLDDWKALLKAADERLEIVNVVQPLGSLMSVLEVKLRSTGT
jgi:6-hydroxytryprostatin B O-methyltransferase